ncbi:MAG: S8 family serine peptidase [Candidatus Edwardsbacteria bacterium]
MKKGKLFLLTIIFLIFFQSIVQAEEIERILVTPGNSPKINEKFQKFFSQMDPQDTVKLWVFFTDKGIFTKTNYERELQNVRNQLTKRSLNRRLKLRSWENVVDFTDLPVFSPYLETLKSKGAKILVPTPWLNGVSVKTTVGSISEIQKLPFVREIRPVAILICPRESEEEKLLPPRKSPRTIETLQYGNSETQLSQIKVPDLHQMGYTGKGVLIAIFDTGFNIVETPYCYVHEALRNAKNHILYQWDFINNDSTTYYNPWDPTNPGSDPEDTDPEQPSHGTKMLALIAGYAPGNLIGSAFGADFLLMKTEIYQGNDITAEEDNWVEAADSAERLGADIISSSLGYHAFFTSPSGGDTLFYYDSLAMNGDSAVTTKAADLAASKGILVINAMGNKRTDLNHPNDPYYNVTYIVAPADADSIIAVGGVNPWTNEWNSTYSVTGPTADGRTKPEVCAAWQAYTIKVDSITAYTYGAGTSCATAIVAGACALLLEAHPSWSNMKVREAIIKTASQSNSPDTILGWGIPDFKKALYYETPEVPPFNQDELADPYPNPANLEDNSDNPNNFKDDELVIPFNLVNQSLVSLYIFTISGELVWRKDLGTYIPGRDYKVPWNGKNLNGKKVASGVYFVLLHTGWGHSVKKIAVVR